MNDGIVQKKDIEFLNGLEYLLSKLQIAISTMKKIENLWRKQNDSNNES